MPSESNGSGAGAGVAGPADPGAVRLADHRLQRGDQAAGAGPPLDLAVRLLAAVHGQPAGHHDEVIARHTLTISRARRGRSAATQPAGPPCPLCQSL